MLPGKVEPERPVLWELYRHAWFQQMKESDRRWQHPRVLLFNRRLTSLRVGDMKLIQGSDGSNALYNLSRDADELNNLSTYPTYASIRESLAKRTRALLHELRTAQPPPAFKAEPLDKDTEDTLRALGYL